MAEGVVEQVTSAPKVALKFGQNHLIAFALIVLLLIVLLVKYETSNPGKVAQKVGKLPLVGKWATTPTRGA